MPDKTSGNVYMLSLHRKMLFSQGRESLGDRLAHPPTGARGHITGIKGHKKGRAEALPIGQR